MFKWGLILQNIIKNVKKIKKSPKNRDIYGKIELVILMNFDKELTLLSEEQVWGVNGGRQLDVLEKYGTIA